MATESEVARVTHDPLALVFVLQIVDDDGDKLVRRVEHGGVLPFYDAERCERRVGPVA